MYVAWNKSWGIVPFGKIALISFGILMLIGHFTLKNKKLMKKVDGLEMKLKKISDQLSNKSAN
jgi:hypothetical protein